MTTNTLDIIEGRPNGRILCYDPATGHTATLIKRFYFPNGVCVSHDGRCVLCGFHLGLPDFPSLARRTDSAGKTEIFIDQMPGLPDNINRASDGHYWLALVGVRTPTYDLAARKAAFRQRMVKQVPTDEWLAPGLNHGCVLKFDEAGNVLESFWDPDRHLALDRDLDARAQGLPVSGRPREQPHRPHSAVRRRSDLDGLRSSTGAASGGCDRMSFLTYLRRDLEQILFPDRDPHAIPSMDGPFSPNDRLDEAVPIGEPIPGANAIAAAADGALLVSAGKSIWRLSGPDYAEPRRAHRARRRCRRARMSSRRPRAGRHRARTCGDRPGNRPHHVAPRGGRRRASSLPHGRGCHCRRDAFSPVTAARDIRPTAGATT